MNIQPIGLNTVSSRIFNNNNKQKQPENTEKAGEYNSFISVNSGNYIIPFLGLDKKINLPKELKQSSIFECQPVDDNENNSDAEQLSAVLSTALKYITPKNPVVLGCSDRYESQKFIIKTFSDDELFEDQQEIENVIFVEDDRIEDKPVMFVTDDKELYVIGDVIIQNKEDNNKLFSNSEIKMPILPDSQNIKFQYTDLNAISLGEIPDKRDLQFIKKFKIEDVLGKEFPTTGDLQPEVFTATVPKDAEYKGNNYPMFSDIGGNKEAIQKVIENIYAPMVFPEILGHIMTKGTILEGPPGTGKSMLGIALCNELSKKLGEQVHLQSISGAEMQISAVGGSEAKWRALFEEASSNQPALILIDEIDACTPKRDGSSNARYDNSVVNQILSLMSNLEKSDDKVHVIGMTNRLDAIDPAMLRNGRFGNIITVAAPNFDEAKDIYNIISKKYQVDDKVDVDKFIKHIVQIKGTGSTIAGTLENAKKYSLRRNDVYKRLLEDKINKEEIESIKITSEDIKKALNDEEEKNKKAKISSDRVVIKGFRS